MYIHTVARGDTLWQLAKQYSVPLEYISNINHIVDDEGLVVGQAIIIPTISNQMTYKVKANDTLARIAKMFGVTIMELMIANQIFNPATLQVGTLLKIPLPLRPEIEVNAYLDKFDEPAIQQLTANADSLTYVSIFSYNISEQGTLIPLADEAVITAAYASNVAPMLTITNIVDEGFSQALISSILSDRQLQSTLISSIIATMQERGFRALNIDIEYIPPELAEAFNAFLSELAGAVQQEGFLISSALAPKLYAEQPGILYESHHYKVNGELLDFVIIMTYEWGWTGGPPLAVAPLNEVKKVMEYAISEIPPHKLMMSVPLYGYDWTLPYVAGESRARAITEQEAILLARRYNARIQFDETAQAPHFTYYDEQGIQHVVWFEDARSYQAKMNLAKDLNLRGISYWKLSMDAPINWFVLAENFIVKKI